MGRKYLMEWPFHRALFLAIVDPQYRTYYITRMGLARISCGWEDQGWLVREAKDDAGAGVSRYRAKTVEGPPLRREGMLVSIMTNSRA